jgi:hypothetical protein
MDLCSRGAARPGLDSGALSQTEGAGRTGRRLRPRPRVQQKSTRVSHHRFNRIIRFSLRNGFNGLLRALPGDRAFLPPSPRGCFGRSYPVGRDRLHESLTPASGRQDHTTSPSASARFVKRAARVHRIPYPTTVTIAIRPSVGRDARHKPLICVRGKQNIFTAEAGRVETG